MEKKPNKDLQYLTEVTDHNYWLHLWNDNKDDDVVKQYLSDEFGPSELEEACELAKYDRKHRITENYKEALKTARAIFGTKEINSIYRKDESDLSPLDKDIKEKYESLVKLIENLRGTDDIKIFVRPSEQELEELRDRYLYNDQAQHR